MDFKMSKVIARTLLLFNWFVLMSSVPAGSYGNVKLFTYPLSYHVDSTVLLNDIVSEDKEVGYKIKSTLLIDPIWSGSDTHFLLKFEIRSPKLHVRSKAAPHEGFIEHASLLDSYKNHPFFAEWKNGIIKNVYINTKEDISWVNYKKALISVFQFQILDQNTDETDISGTCNTHYDSIGPNNIRKIKNNCIHDGIPKKDTNNILSTVLTSSRMTNLDFTEDLTALFHIYAEELHEMKLGMRQDAGNKIRVWHDLKFLGKDAGSARLKANSFSEALPEVEAQYGFVLKSQSLKLSISDEESEETSYNLAKMIKDNRELLMAENLGTEASVLVFMKILKVMRLATTEEIINSIKGVKNKEIIEQFCDMLGYTQTLQSHEAAKRFLNFDNEYDKDNIERYLWALSVGPRPQGKVIVDILGMIDSSKMMVHVKETLLLTAASMANRYVENNGNNSQTILGKVQGYITTKLAKCKDSACIIQYLRALQNLKSRDTIPILLDHARKGTKSVAVMAMKALRAMPAQYWAKEVIDLCKKILYQLEKPYDSSARTLAADIMIEARPPFFEIEEMLDYLASADKEYEVKQFVLQRLQMLAERCGKSQQNINYLLSKHRYINNYNVLAQKGLSTALVRNVSYNAWSNVSLVSVQEISGGMLKRGHVDLVVEEGGEAKRLFSLGLFANGLSSMIGGSSEEEEADDEPAAAGMELGVLGAHLRPFTFFSGQGELMGHVWSGTASERTAAFQSLMVIQEETGATVLGSGGLARWRLSAAASVSLGGQVQLSLWSRTAHSLVDNTAGILVQGAYNAHTGFVKSEVRFALSLAPRLDLESDIDFYDGVKLCVQVQQPNFIVRHNITKMESIPQHSHVMRKAKYKSVVVPGRTYALNRKNNIMCKEIHEKK